MFENFIILDKKEHLTQNPLPEIFLKYQNEETLIWLDSSKEDAEIGRFSILGLNPIFKIKTFQNKIEIEDPNNVFPQQKTNLRNTTPNQFLRHLLRTIKLPNVSLKIPFKAGLLGYFGYEYLEEAKPNKKYLGTPDSFFIFPGLTFIYDHYQKILYTIEISRTNSSLKKEKQRQNMNHKLQIPNTKLQISNSKYQIANTKYQITNSGKLAKKDQLKLSYETSKKEYFEIFNEIQRKISAGEMYECCFTHKIGLKNLTNLENLYLDLRKNNPASFSAFIKFEDYKVLSCSPERFLKLENKTAEMRPIKGTIKRGKNEQEEIRNLEKLKNSIKNQAENIMIVDLIRNDLGRVSEIGSVRVRELFKIEKYSSLFQMISIIESKLANKYDFFDLLEATFPGGSMTGAPKIRAMEYIKKYEKTKREIYSGSIGYIDLSGNADFSIVIRTIIHDLKKKQAVIGIGGAIVFDSKKTAEYQESLLKAKKIIEIIEINSKMSLTKQLKK